uniref:Uncharacterized protein n=1 Tax=Chlamydomonas chlamydogama TaxID=225041 RepID=A0A6T5U1A1_9CHLO|mmetsp:Transcript_244/g.444  ORF Transcript_244/g.444 Transcript_244/m.444 type:complete len:318 (+) Transcript_244:201-1154(+)|eukprot:CAMPEP_0202902330 /NCGR_PEP_ID=MMETSP1392-20130828/16790_1 /ASSEMBLY_ACC=CAM_ASM_000868 /TAXON_ID=225041 /ORGANISM="Chlamydomonas chlamydogama, Strain SAG 11-48b" /LENGTH=317 /DNA_ID=CAMNT_0049589079 /DNA_START=184 /DNA_END=1137 /DNA_ORIENTATION=+
MATIREFLKNDVDILNVLEEAKVSLNIPAVDFLPGLTADVQREIGLTVQQKMRLNTLLQRLSAPPPPQGLWPPGALSQEAYAHVQKCVFALQDCDCQSDADAGPFSCVGFFAGSAGRAATAAHCLGSHPQEGDTVRAYMPHYKKHIVLKVTHWFEELDIAMLQYDIPPGTPEGADHPGTSYLQPSHEYAIPGSSIALCSCTIHITKELDEKFPVVGVYQASIVRYTHDPQRIVYNCPTFEGDCGSAVLLHDGKLIGLHVEAINQLKERIEKDKIMAEVDGEHLLAARLASVEESVDSAIRGTAHVALAVCAQEFLAA